MRRRNRKLWISGFNYLTLKKIVNGIPPPFLQISLNDPLFLLPLLTESATPNFGDVPGFINEGSIFTSIVSF